MKSPLIAMAQIIFSNQAFHEDDAQAIEQMLRNDGTVDNLSIDNMKVAFYIEGRIAIDYSVLENIKNELTKRGYTNFLIAADEYARTANKYYYNANEKAIAS